MSVGDRLGTNTNLRDTFDKLNEYGKRLKASSDKGLQDKYTLDEVSIFVQKWYEFDKQKFARFAKDPEKLPSFKRNTVCGHITAYHSAIKKSLVHEDWIVQTNIAQCGSVWVCPICAVKIQARRAVEVAAAVEWAENNGYKVVLATFTASHKAHFLLKDFGGKLGEAYRRTLDQVKRERKKYEVGNIRALEMTWSARNGWHPHFHTLFFVREDCDIDAYFEEIGRAWKAQCIRLGLLDEMDVKAVKAFDRHSYHYTGGDINYNYLTKSSVEWGAGNEIASQARKEGRVSGHYTPFQILYELSQVQNIGVRMKLMTAYVEYMLYTKQINQLAWSRGLKELVGVKHKSDEELCEEEREKGNTVGGLTIAHWHALRSRYARIKYFQMAKNCEGSPRVIAAFFRKLDPTLPDLLSCEEVQMLETASSYDDPECEDELLRLIVLLYDISYETPTTYTALSKYNPCCKAINDFLESLRRRAV